MEEQPTSQNFVGDIKLSSGKFVRKYAPSRPSQFRKLFGGGQDEKHRLNSNVGGLGRQQHKLCRELLSQQHENQPSQPSGGPDRLDVSGLVGITRIQQIQFITQQARSKNTSTSKTALSVLNNLYINLINKSEFVDPLTSEPVTLDEPALLQLLKFYYTLPNVSLYGRHLLRDGEEGIEMASMETPLEVVYLLLQRPYNTQNQYLPALNLLCSLLLQDEGYLTESLVTFPDRMLHHSLYISEFLQSMLELQVIQLLVSILNYGISQQERILCFLVIERYLIGTDDSNEHINRQYLVELFQNELFVQLQDIGNGFFVTTGRICLRCLTFLGIETKYDRLEEAMCMLRSQEDILQNHEVFQFLMMLIMNTHRYDVFDAIIVESVTQIVQTSMVLNSALQVCLHASLHGHPNLLSISRLYSALKPQLANCAFGNLLYGRSHPAARQQPLFNNLQLLDRYIYVDKLHLDDTLVNQILYSVYYGVEIGGHRGILQNLLSGNYSMNRIANNLLKHGIILQCDGAPNQIFHRSLRKDIYAQIIYLKDAIDYAHFQPENVFRMQECGQVEQQLCTMLELVASDKIVITKNSGIRDALAKLEGVNMNQDVLRAQLITSSLSNYLKLFISKLEVADIYLPTWLLRWLRGGFPDGCTEARIVDQKLGSVRHSKPDSCLIR